ncbi:MAG: ABC transporter substrate-binding protein [Marmoricola sp.]
MTRARRTAGVLMALAALVAALTAVPSGPSSAAGSCAGFTNRTGVTSTTITIANVSDLTGPVPGLGRPALDGVRAFVSYFNASSSICGRKLRVEALDSKTDAQGSGAAYSTACSHAFAAVGSWSLFDNGGSWTAQNCGLPDLRSTSASPQRDDCTTCFGVQASQADGFPNAIPDFFLSHHHAASQAVGLLYANTQPYAAKAATMLAAEQERGLSFVYSAGIGVAEFDYAPYVADLKSHGVQLVQFVGSYQQAVRLAQAMQDAAYAPLFQADPRTYGLKPYVSTGGTAVEGTLVPINITPFSEAAGNTELRRYVTYLRKVHPGAAPSIDGLFAWSAARLFVDRAASLGGHLSRANLVSSVRGVHAWTDSGAHSSQNVGSKVVGTCWRFLQLTSGAWTPVGGTAYSCTGRTVVPTP